MKKLIIKKGLIALFLMGICLSTIAQVEDDFQGLLSVKASKKLWHKKLKLSIEEEFRGKNNTTEMDRISSGVSLLYNNSKFKSLKLGVGYELLSYFTDNRIEENKHRFSVTARYKYEYAGWALSYRSRLQTTLRNTERGAYKENPKNVWRNKMGLAYDIYGSPFTPYLTGEVYNSVFSPYYNEFKQYRICVGTEYRINKDKQLDVYFRYIRKFNTLPIENVYSIGFAYSFDL